MTRVQPNYAIARTLRFEQCEQRRCLATLNFGLHEILSIPHRLTDVAPADMDGDGDLDVVYSSMTNHQIGWYENIDASGTFGFERVIATDSHRVGDISVGDVDGDGDLDVISAARLESNIGWYENLDGSGTFGPYRGISAISVSASSVTMGDVDLDGDLDAVYPDKDRIAWSENSGGGTFATQPKTIVTAESPEGVSLVDVDGDRDLDILVEARDKIFWVENLDGAGNFGTERLISSGAWPKSVTGDLDGDGDLDVAVSTRDHKLAWHENIDGNGNFAAARLISNDASRSRLDEHRRPFLGDLNGDADLDVIIADTNLKWFENTDGKGDFGEFTKLDASTFSVMSIGDLDNDNDLDLLVITDKIIWYENTAAKFDVESRKDVSLGGHSQSFSTTVGDLDGDGDLDVLTTHKHFQEQQSRIGWHENRDGFGDLGTQQLIAIATTESFRAVAVGDVDGDGDMDVVASSHRSGPFTTRVTWYENLDGGGTFGGPHEVAMETWASRSTIALGDIDGDGDLDISDAAGGWYENLDAGSRFAAHPRAGVGGSSFRDPSFHDFDGDGDLDIVANTADGNTTSGIGVVVWLQNENGRGLFVAPQVIARGFNHADAGDVDGDGDIDLLAASSSDVGGISWFEHVDGRLSREHVISTTDRVSAWADSAQLVDMDADGDLDVIAHGPNGMGWYENLGGTGRFVPRRDIGEDRESSTVSAFSFATGDIDGDGDMDFVDGFNWHESNLKVMPKLIAGDANADGRVDEADFRVLADHFGRIDATFEEGDFDGDGRVAFTDFLILSEALSKQ